MAKVELGVKRTCFSCNMRFYDFNRSPIVCPGCGTEFDFKNLAKSKNSRETKKVKTKKDISDSVADSDDEPINGGDDPEKTNGGVDEESRDDDEEEVDEEDVDDVDDTDEPSIIRDELSDEDPLLPSLDRKEE